MLLNALLVDAFKRTQCFQQEVLVKVVALLIEVCVTNILTPPEEQ